MALILNKGKPIANVPVHELPEWLKKQEQPAENFTIQLTPKENKAIVREKIQQSAGDPLSILGTTSDTALLILLHFSQFIVELEKADNISQVREAATIFSDTANTFLTALQHSNTTLPFQVKGIENVLSEIIYRAKATSSALQPSTDTHENNLINTYTNDKMSENEENLMQREEVI